MNNYSKEVMQAVRIYLGLDKNDTSKDDDILRMNKKEIATIVYKMTDSKYLTFGGDYIFTWES